MNQMAVKLQEASHQKLLEGKLAAKVCLFKASRASLPQHVYASPVPISYSVGPLLAYTHAHISPRLILNEFVHLCQGQSCRQGLGTAIRYNSLENLQALLNGCALYMNELNALSTLSP